MGNTSNMTSNIDQDTGDYNNNTPNMNQGTTYNNNTSNNNNDNNQEIIYDERSNSRRRVTKRKTLRDYGITSDGETILLLIQNQKNAGTSTTSTSANTHKRTNLCFYDKTGSDNQKSIGNHNDNNNILRKENLDILDEIYMKKKEKGSTRTLTSISTSTSTTPNSNSKFNLTFLNRNLNLGESLSKEVSSISLDTSRGTGMESESGSGALGTEV